MLSDEQVSSMTLASISELIPAYKDHVHSVINKLAASRNYIELIDKAETGVQKEMYRARALQGIDEVIKLIRCE